MSRPTWGDLKKLRDGTTAPVVALPGMTPADTAYMKELKRKAERLSGDVRDLEWDLAELQREIDIKMDTRRQIVDELESMGVEVDDWGNPL